MNHAEIIEKLLTVRAVIQTMQNVPLTAHNCNIVLGSIQQIDAVIEAIKGDKKVTSDG